MSKLKFRTQYDRAASDDHGVSDFGPAVKQSFKDECDINVIVSRFHKTGQLPDSARAAARQFGDFSQVPTLMEMYQKVALAEEMFMALPAKARKELDNDPRNLVALASTEEGRQELLELGFGPEDIQASSPSPAAPGAPVGEGGTPSKKSDRKVQASAPKSPESEE